MQVKRVLGKTLVLVLLVMAPSVAGEEIVKRVVFTDTSAPVCDVGDALGSLVPPCAPPIVTLCSSLDCPAFDIVDQGPVAGDVSGDITVCIRLESAPDPNLFLPVSGCVLIETDDQTWTGPFTGSFNLVYGAFGDYFVRETGGDTIRARFTQVSAPGDPPLFVNTGTLIRSEKIRNDN